jgi:hypothetical protein
MAGLSAHADRTIAQTVSQKGFVEFKGIGYPQTAAGDDTQAVGELLLRYEATAKPAAWFRLSGSIDARADTHDQTSWERLDWSDRIIKRPSLGVRRFDATLGRGPLTLQVGKQFIRWGKADILNPTDRFAPRDFLSVFDTDVLAVTAVRFTAGLQSDTLDVVASRFSPSRVPLIGQRWAPMEALPAGVVVVDRGATYPDRAQLGARWNHVGGGYEFSLSGFSGNNHIPRIVATVPPYPTLTVDDPIVLLSPSMHKYGNVFVPSGLSAEGALAAHAIESDTGPHLRLDALRPQVNITRHYPAMWMAGGDGAMPLSAFTVKGEAAFFGSNDARTDEYWLYVIQIERQAGEWFLVGGYAGEAVTRKRSEGGFAPDRGLTNAVLGRAGYTIDTNRSIAVDGAVRQNGDGSWLRVEYSQASGQHLRVTTQATWLRGAPDDFFGRYRRNSNATLIVRCSF